VFHVDNYNRVIAFSHAGFFRKFGAMWYVVAKPE